MTWPVPAPGLVIRYSYLWDREAEDGREEGIKDRPCAIVLVRSDEATQHRVRVLPVTHAPPADPDHALEIPPATKARLGLDGERSWIVLTEANDFVWPGPDLRPRPGGRPMSIAYGFLPPGFFAVLRQRLVDLRRRRIVRRTS